MGGNWEGLWGAERDGRGFGVSWGGWEWIGRRFQGLLGGLGATGRVLGGAWGVGERFLGVLSPADPPEMPPDAARSKMLTGIGGFVLGFVFLALGLGFYLRKKVRGGPGGRVPPAPERLCSPRGPPARCHPLFSAHRAPEPPPAAAPPRGLGPGRDPPLCPRADFGGSCVPPALLSL